MKVEFQKKGCEKKSYETINWLATLWFMTRADEGFYIRTVKGLKAEGFAGIVDGLEDQNDDLAVFEWSYLNGNHYYAGIEGVTLESLGENPKEKLAELLCKNQEFLKAIELHYLKIDGDFILEWCKPENPLMPNELRVF